MVKELENKIVELKEKRARIRKYVQDNENNKEMWDLINICKGQSIELLNQIQYLQKLVKELKGE